MNWSSQVIRDAARQGDYGRVVSLARRDAGVSQRQLGDACGISQSAVSRLEGRGTAAYDMTILARAATHLHFPPRLVGLADHTAAHAAENGQHDVHRRNFLAGTAAIAAAPALAVLHAQPADARQAATLRVATTAFRRLDAATSSRHLSEPVLAHLRLTQTVTAEAESPEQRACLAAVGSEAASLAGWLAWDMNDIGSARTWYGTAIKAARASGDRLLTAYQLGSLAGFEADAGNAAQGLALVHRARHQLGADAPAIASAWLGTVEALAHAVAGDRVTADAVLEQAARHTEAVPDEQPPPWPWVFSFTPSKVAAARLTCGARLGIPEWVSASQDAATAALASGHEKQRALLALDLAAAHMAEGRLDGAFALAARALEMGVRYRSGRVIERARSLRRGYTSPTPPRVVRDFDERLHGIYL
ncbi:helix-turn-helix transcriptional regulator [Streptomyces sp. NBS 14/10]|uniref:helix-turn-helix domain-containing protein n=1 Tax=Streptomyces sp. NBS 14/10 TaxID=1945643 RepID=UPI000D1A0568|nr:helix-turn-helix transcriptional regulator [Streptomyces sp. NBS 14/10]KAK1180693.1 helix-turn-helix transcriptional regulator [Streptomyces sp. NBS 14/10]